MSSIGHEPEEKWVFDQSVTDVFDDMLSRSIPQYDIMRTSCIDVARRFFRPQTSVYDLGCSRGETIWGAFGAFGGQGLYVGLEISEPMLDASRERFKSLIDCGIVRINKHDLRTGAPVVNASVVFSVLTLQFVPVNYRHRIVEDAWRGLGNGGAMVMVEKVLGPSSAIDSMLVDVYHKKKMENGYSAEEIERKRMSLEGVLVPMTAEANRHLLLDAGFAHVDCFWRWMNFAGFIGVKR